MKEDEAKTKWCPQSRYILSDEGRLISNRQWHVNDPWENCLASDCMMWRWATQEDHEKTGVLSSDGHCGLAGKE